MVINYDDLVDVSKWQVADTDLRFEGGRHIDDNIYIFGLVVVDGNIDNENLTITAEINYNVYEDMFEEVEILSVTPLGVQIDTEHRQGRKLHPFAEVAPSIVKELEAHNRLFPPDIMAELYGKASRVRRSAKNGTVQVSATLTPGTLITDLEGYDLGDQGAVVISVDGDEAELAKLDSEEIITVDLGGLAYVSEEPPKAPGINPELIDEEALHSPELHTIRWLPLWWGPKDPNSPSSITDTLWRPEPIWRRQMQRRYHVEDPMSHKTRPKSRVSASEAPALPPDPTGKTQLERDYGLPRRMRLDLWIEGDADPLNKDALRDLACEFWTDYRTKRQTYMSEHGDRKSMSLEDYALAFQRRLGLTRDEMTLFYDFMVATKLVPPNEADQYQDLIDTYQTYRYDWL